jgi:hypothetical protein
MEHRAVIHEIRGKVHVSNVYVFAVHELFEMVANELPAFGVSHSGLGIDRFHRRPQALAAWL